MVKGDYNDVSCFKGLENTSPDQRPECSGTNVSKNRKLIGHTKCFNTLSEDMQFLGRIWG